MKDEIYSIINKAIDDAIKFQKYQLNLYSFLTSQSLKRKEVLSFIHSSLASQIKDEIAHLDLYLSGDSEAAYLREVYDWMGKLRAKKYKEYLMKMIEDAEKYEREKRPGRKPGSKRKAATTNK